MTELASTDARVSVAGFDPGASGVTPPSGPARRGVFLADVIVELGFADRETIDEAVRAAGQSGSTVESFLLDGGILDEHRLSLAIAERHGLDHVDLDRFEVDLEAAELIGRSAALRYSAVPIAFAADGALIVAVEDPVASLGISDIEVMTRSAVRPAIATGSGIRQLVERLPEGPAAKPPPAAAEPERPPEPELDSPSESDTEPEPEPESPPEPASPDADLDPGAEPGDLSVELRSLRETARRADALAVSVERRIGQLGAAGEQAQRLERELAAAEERNAELERRLAGVDGVAAELRATTEGLETAYRTLEESVGDDGG